MPLRRADKYFSIIFNRIKCAQTRRETHSNSSQSRLLNTLRSVHATDITAAHVFGEKMPVFINDYWC